MSNRVPEWKDVVLGQVPPSSTNIKEEVVFENKNFIGFPYRQVSIPMNEMPVKSGDFLSVTIDGKLFQGKLEHKKIHTRTGDNGVEIYDEWYYFGNLGIILHALDKYDDGDYNLLELNDAPYIVGFVSYDNGLNIGFSFIQIADYYNDQEVYPETAEVSIKINGVGFNFEGAPHNFVNSCGYFAFGLTLDKDEYDVIFDGKKYHIIYDASGGVFINSDFCQFLDRIELGSINYPQFNHSIKIFRQVTQEDNGYGWSEENRYVLFSDIHSQVFDSGDDYQTTFAVNVDFKKLFEEFKNGAKFTITVNGVDYNDVNMEDDGRFITAVFGGGDSRSQGRLSQRYLSDSVTYASFSEVIAPVGDTTFSMSYTKETVHKISDKYLGGVDLELSVPAYTKTETYTTDDINIVSGSIESVMQKVNNGEMVNVVVRTDTSNGQGYVHQEWYDVVEVSTYGESIYIHYRNREVRMFTNNTLRVYTHSLQLSPDGTLMYHNCGAFVIACSELTNA